MFPLFLPLISAVAGAALNKKKPLNGALLGGGLGLAGGALAPGLLGGPALAADPLAAYMTSGAAEGSTLGGSLFGGGSSGAVGQGSAAGMFDAALGGLKTASQYAQPVGQALNAANAAQGLFGQRQMPIAPPAQIGNPGNDPIAQLLAQQRELELQRMRARYGSV